MRRADGIDRLAAYCAAIAGKPFHQTAHNCAIFVLGALEALTTITREEVLARIGVAEIPDTQVGVLRVLAERGGMRGLAEAFFGSPPLPPSICARRGDIAILDGDEGEVLGVVEVNGIIILSPLGLDRAPTSSMKGYWSLE